jgi:hypothetical protein
MVAIHLGGCFYLNSQPRENVMGVKIINRKEYTDDVDGTVLSDDVQPLRLSLNGDNWEIYLSDQHEAELRDALHKFTANVTATSNRRTASVATEGRRGRGPNRDPKEIEAERKAKADKQAQREEIVAWGKANPGDFKVNESGRGRLDTKLIDAFYAANKKAERLH